MTNRKIEYWVIPPDADIVYIGCGRPEFHARELADAPIGAFFSRARALIIGHGCVSGPSVLNPPTER